MTNWETTLIWVDGFQVLSMGYTKGAPPRFKVAAD